MQDVATALRTHLLTVEAITDLTSTRIYTGEIPDDAETIQAMPVACIVLRYVGGYVKFRTHREQEPRLDIFCYGRGYIEAGQVDGAVADALIAIKRLDIADTLIHSVGTSGGPRQLKEEKTGWRYVARSAIVRAGETTTA